MTKADLKKMKDLMETGVPIPQALNQLELRDRPGPVRQALFKEYGQDTIQTIIREKIRPNMQANGYPATQSRVKRLSKRLLEQADNPEKVDELVAMYFQLIAEAREKKSVLIRAQE